MIFNVNFKTLSGLIKSAFVGAWNFICIERIQVSLKSEEKNGYFK